MDGAAASDTATFAAIVIGFQELPQNETVDIHSISLCSGDIATRPAPQSKQAVLDECERYYEKSYQETTAPGAAEVDNCLSETQQANYLSVAGTYEMYQCGFGFKYRNVKRSSSPTVSLYSPAGSAAGNVQANIWGDGAASIGQGSAAIATYWSSNTISDKGAQYQPGGTVGVGVTVSSGAGSGQGVGWIRYHYVVDARLGIV